MSGPPADVRNDATAHRFVIVVDGREAELLYRKRAGRLILIHTEVPAELGGQGLGGRLVLGAVAYARAQHLTVVPWCPFARRWLADHPADCQGVSIDWAVLPPPESGGDGRSQGPPEE